MEPQKPERSQTETLPNERNPEWLAKERERQIGILLESEVYRHLGQTREEFLDSIPPLEPQPTQWVKRFPLPVLVIPKLNLNHDLQLLKRYREHVPLIEERRIQIVQNAKGITIPETPYWGWIQNGSNLVDTPVFEWEKSLKASDEIGTTLQEVCFAQLYYEIAKPEEEIDLIAPGSIVITYEPEKIASLSFSEDSVSFLYLVNVDAETLRLQQQEGTAVTQKIISRGDWTKVKS